MKCLDDTALNKVQFISSRKVFKFGDGWEIYSNYKTVIPAKIGKTECCIQTKIVNEKIPLLLSKSLLKKADIKYQRWQSSNVWSWSKCVYVNKSTLCCWDFRKVM